LFESAIHSLLLRLEPEAAHGLAMSGLRGLQRVAPALQLFERQHRLVDSRLVQEIWGRQFPNPIGLAAGFDKDAVAVPALAAMGFGFLEVGTVTPTPQAGNPRPRLFRHRELRSLQNSMGFNNAGMESLRRRLAKNWPPPVPIGVNIGKNRQTELTAAAKDYSVLVQHLKATADYFVINISSPNTPGLRDLQRGETVARLLEVCRKETDTPVLVKLSPDMEDQAAADLARVAADGGAAGLILTNTTIDYSLVPEPQPNGGLSGRVLRRRSLELLKVVASEVFGRCVLVSVGGIESAADVYARLRAGAHLTQIYTALVYGGSHLVREINEELLDLLERDDLADVASAVGLDV
jgi:dihydroorotate dehydrogenase